MTDTLDHVEDRAQFTAMTEGTQEDWIIIAAISAISRPACRSGC